MANAWRFFTAERIASVTGCPVANVAEHHPRIVEQLAHAGIDDRPSQIAAIGTIAIETASTYRPVKEAFYLGEPAAEAHRKTLAYYPYYGRGYIQLTHRSNYAKYGPKIAALWQTSPDQPDFDLVGDPDNALNPDIAAAVLALYFRDHGGDGQRRIPKAAAAGDWAEVRRLVQGGNAGLDRLVQIATALTSDPALPSTAGYVFPVDGYTGAIELHWGTFAGASDLFAARGTPVRAVRTGTVVYRSEWGAVGGNAVQIDHDGDGLESYYAHGDRPPEVRMGQRVDAGTFLFGVGDSGNASQAGPHLHFGMGKEILTGSGPSGGGGSDFDAVSFLRRLRAATPEPIPPVDLRAELLALVDTPDERLALAGVKAKLRELLDRSA